MSERGRILIIEDQLNWQEVLHGILTDAGFAVEVVASSPAAIEKLQQSLYHLAIIDIRLVDQDVGNVEGMNLLRQIEQLGLGESMEKVMISAYGTKQQMREAFTQYDAADFISKSEFDPVEFHDTIQKIFAERVRANFALNIHLEDGLTYENLVTGLVLDGQRLKPGHEAIPRAMDEFIDLLQRLFCEAEGIVLRPLSTGHGGSRVVKVEPYYPYGRGETVVLKYGDYRELDVEYQHFEQYVQSFIGAGRATNAVDIRRTAWLGGIIYSLLGTRLDRAVDFAHFYGQHGPADIVAALDDLFKDTCGTWYTNRVPVQDFAFTEEYQRMLRLEQAHLERALQDNFPAYLGQPTITFAALGETHFTNPVYAVLGRRFTCPTYRCVTHGDLNGSNIFVDENGHTWLIDFYRTGEGHILRDCIALEAAIKFTLLPTKDLVTRYALERALVGVERFSGLEQMAYSAPNDDLAKAFAVALKVRQLARELVQPSDDFREYDIGLLYQTVNVLRFYGLPKVNRQHALLAASLLCDKLGLSPMGGEHA